MARVQDTRPTGSITVLLALLAFARPYHWLALGALLALLATAAVTLILPLFVRQFVDRFANAPLDEFNRSFLWALVIAAALAIGTALRYALVTRLGERMVVDLRSRVFDKAVGMSPVFFERIMTGEVTSRINTDTTLVLSLIASTVSVALRNLLILSGGLVLMAITSPRLTLLATILVPAILIPTLLLGRLLRRQSRDNQDHMARGSAAVSEVLHNIQMVQAFGQEWHFRRRFRSIGATYLDSVHRRILTRSVLTALIIILVFAGIATVIWVGAGDARDNRISIGQLVQFIIYAVLVGGAVSTLADVWGELLRAAGATDRILELLALDDAIKDPHVPVPVPAGPGSGLAFNAVTFSYPLRPESPVLQDLSLSIASGETVALVGPSGAGKTSIFQLLLRFYEASNGTVSIDGIDIAKFRRAELRSLFALVPQEAALFADSIMDNIRIGNPAATDAEVIAAARSADLHDFLQSLPEGFATRVGEGGVLLSGGQRQRLAIARALLRDSPVLLLDEATSSLDAASEAAVQKAVRRIAGTRTLLIIAHRLATAKFADRILVLDQGRLVAQGQHDTLMAEGGLYARLASLQFIDARMAPGQQIIRQVSPRFAGPCGSRK